MKTINWDTKKAEILRNDNGRGNVSFEDCVIALEEGRILDDILNPSKKYPDQRMFVLGINNYAYIVPYVETNNEIFLKTVFPSKAYRNLFNLGKVMKNIPKVTNYIDDDEKQLIEAIERDDYQVGRSALTSDRLQELQAGARAKMNEERAPISLRIPKTDLSRLKTRAMQEGIPYQTLINSILHKSVN